VARQAKGLFQDPHRRSPRVRAQRLTTAAAAVAVAVRLHHWRRGYHFLFASFYAERRMILLEIIYKYMLLKKYIC